MIEDQTETEKKPAKVKKKKPKFVDDGHTVYSMEGLTGGKRDDKDVPSLTGKEKRALIRAALARYLPMLLLVIGCFSVAALLVYLWLN